MRGQGCHSVHLPQCVQRHRINLASHFRRATMFVLYLILAVLAFWLLFVTKKPANSPPGPWFRLPLLGHSLWFIGGRIKGYQKLRDRQVE